MVYALLHNNKTGNSLYSGMGVPISSIVECINSIQFMEYSHSKCYLYVVVK